MCLAHPTKALVLRDEGDDKIEGALCGHGVIYALACKVFLFYIIWKETALFHCSGGGHCLVAAMRKKKEAAWGSSSLCQGKEADLYSGPLSSASLLFWCLVSMLHIFVMLWEKKKIISKGKRNHFYFWSHDEDSYPCPYYIFRTIKENAHICKSVWHMSSLGKLWSNWVSSALGNQPIDRPKPHLWLTFVIYKLGCIKITCHLVIRPHRKACSRMHFRRLNLDENFRSQIMSQFLTHPYNNQTCLFHNTIFFSYWTKIFADIIYGMFD